MDTITHTLFGAVIYKSIKTEEMTSNYKKSLLFTSIIGSQIPDIDVVSKLFDTNGMYQMWHRGITHSLFMAPIWAGVIWLLSYLFWRVKDKKIFYVGLFSIFIHITSDVFNAWGTGYFEPFSSIRLSVGTIPIVDFFIWGIIFIGYLLVKIKKFPAQKVYKTVFIVILVHVFAQTAQGFILYETVKEKYDETALSASFVPWHYQVIGKKDGEVEISNYTIWGKPSLKYTLQSNEQADLDLLFEQNPEAKALHMWSPFVVIIDNEEMLGIYDPRFYRNGQSFLFEFIEK